MKWNMTQGTNIMNQNEIFLETEAKDYKNHEPMVPNFIARHRLEGASWVLATSCEDQQALRKDQKQTKTRKKAKKRCLIEDELFVERGRL